jgi:hypothetical protein
MPATAQHAVFQVLDDLGLLAGAFLDPSGWNAAGWPIYTPNIDAARARFDADLEALDPHLTTAPIPPAPGSEGMAVAIVENRAVRLQALYRHPVAGVVVRWTGDVPPGGFCSIGFNDPIVVTPFASGVAACGIVWIGVSDTEVDAIIAARIEDPRANPGPAIAFTATPDGDTLTIDFNAG